MPRRLPSPCRYPGCKALRLPPARYCPAHSRELARDRFSRNLEKGQGDGRATGNKFYSTAAWRRTRAWVLNHEPLCRLCGAVADMVDHIAPLHEGGDPTDLENLQPLCNPCHAAKRGREGIRALKRQRGGQP